ncbi:MAG: hypothetical protein JW829_10960 [Pirellulales bacterium]|nr:hypothetical protein [Pirellulales bacterium]
MPRTLISPVSWMPWIFLLILGGRGLAETDDPPAIHPFGPGIQARDDAIPGFIEMSDKTIVPGSIYLTRDIRLRIYDASAKRHRDIPLQAIRRIECRVQREWVEKEWRHKENANDEKVYSGRSYPAREYIHSITFQDQRKVVGPVSAIVYIQEESSDDRKQFLLHKRHKGDYGSTLESLVYVRRIELGSEAFEEGKRLAAASRDASSSKKPGIQESK